VARLAAKQMAPCFSDTLPQMARLWPANLMRHGAFLARLVFANEKAWLQQVKTSLCDFKVLQSNMGYSK